MIKVRRLEENLEMITYEFSTKEEAVKKFDQWKAEFRQKNKTDILKNDKTYEEYCQMLDDLLDSYIKEEPEKQRNITNAKENRARGISHWNKKEA
jgi:hypothetical protein